MIIDVTITLPITGQLRTFQVRIGQGGLLIMSIGGNVFEKWERRPWPKFKTFLEKNYSPVTVVRKPEAEA